MHHNKQVIFMIVIINITSRFFFFLQIQLNRVWSSLSEYISSTFEILTVLFIEIRCFKRVTMTARYWKCNRTFWQIKSLILLLSRWFFLASASSSLWIGFMTVKYSILTHQLNGKIFLIAKQFSHNLIVALKKNEFDSLSLFLARLIHKLWSNQFHYFVFELWSYLLFFHSVNIHPLWQQKAVNFNAVLFKIYCLWLWAVKVQSKQRNGRIGYIFVRYATKSIQHQVETVTLWCQNINIEFSNADCWFFLPLFLLPSLIQSFYNVRVCLANTELFAK